MISTRKIIKVVKGLSPQSLIDDFSSSFHTRCKYNTHRRRVYRQRKRNSDYRGLFRVVIATLNAALMFGNHVG